MLFERLNDGSSTRVDLPWIEPKEQPSDRTEYMILAKWFFQEVWLNEKRHLVPG